MKTKDLSQLAKKIPTIKTSQSDNDAVKVVIALAAGLAAGAALGILFAPDKGGETRDKLSESLSNLSATIKETAVAELDRLADLRGKVVDSIKTKINGAEQDYQDDLEHA